MKDNKKKQRKSLPLIIVLIILIVAAIAVTVWMRGKAEDAPDVKEPVENAGDNTENENEDTGAVEDTETENPQTNITVERPPVREYEVVPVTEGAIETPYGTLTFPDGLSDHLLVIKTGDDPYVLEFYAVMEGKRELRLFDLTFGGDEGNMGTVATDGGEVPFGVIIYNLDAAADWPENQVTTVFAMQDAVNDIIDMLSPEKEEEQTPVIADPPEEVGTVNNLELETPYCTLYYPAIWSGNITVEHDDTQEAVYKVHFYSRIEGTESQLLFSVYFGGDEGEQIGAVMSSDNIPVPVNIIMGQLETEGLAEYDIELLYEMQEASNDLIDRLPLLQ